MTFAPFIISIALGILCFIFVANIYQVRLRRSPEIEKRLETIKKSSEQQNSIIAPDFITVGNEFHFGFLGKYLKNFKPAEYIKNQLYYSGVGIQIDVFLLLSIVCGLPFIILSTFITPYFLILGVFGSLVPFFIVKFMIMKRTKLFTEQFPEALDLLSNSLRAGHSLYSAFDVIAKDMPAPINQVFKSTVDEIAFGIDIKDAILSLNKVMPFSMDLKFFTTAVLLQREVGGNLTKILDGLSVTIRERFKMLGQLKAQTAQSKFSGIVLTLVPPLIAVVLFFISPGYMDPLLHTTAGNIALAIAVGLLVIGMICIIKIVSIEI